MKTYQEFISEAKKCWPGYKKKGTQKLFGKTYNRCVKEEVELEESSMGERSGRRTRGNVTLARGRGADMDRSERTTAAIAKKAGLKGTGKFSTKDLRTKSKDYTTYDSEDDSDDYGSTEQDHYIRTHSSPRKAAKGEQLIKKFKPAGRTPSGMTKLKTAPSSESVRRVKDLKKQMTKTGANKTGKVHTVDIMHRDSEVGKGDKYQQMERGRNFIQALKDTPKHLKKAGAQKGDTVVGKPTAVMSGEDMKTGEAKRAKLYKKAFGKRSTERSAKTGLMTGAVDEEFKQMPGELMNRQIRKLSQSQSNLRKGRQTEKKRDREIKYDMQIKRIQMAGKQDYNNGKDSYDVFYKNPLETGKIVNHRFR
jgi:hypothetical protein